VALEWEKNKTGEEQNVACACGRLLVEAGTEDAAGGEVELVHQTEPMERLRVDELWEA
jgi:hypothetical protein